jgi:spore coat protein U-like protein
MIRRMPLLLLLWISIAPASAEAQSCTYTVAPTLDFGSVLGAPVPQIDVTSTMSVTCTGPILGVLPTRVCISIPAGTAGSSIADRRMASGAHFVQYQIYTDAARTQIWGALGGTSPPRAVDFALLSGTQTQNITVYGRIFSGQGGKSVGTYLSDLTPIQARATTYLLSPPNCSSVSTSPTTLATMTSRLVINPNCSIGANTLDFGTVTGTGTVTASSNLSVTCTLNAAYAIALDGGSVNGDVSDRRMKRDGGSETIAYQLYRDSARTLIWGNTSGTTMTGTGSGGAQSIPVFGTVPSRSPSPPGVYRDVITATITY